MLSFRLRAFIVVLFCFAPRMALAQYTSTQPVRFIVGQAAGGGGDIATRILAEELSQAIGQAMVVENRPGALGTVAARAVAQAAPDGHTLLTVGGTAITAAPHLMASLPYDPQKDLIPIYQLASSPMVLLVSGESPAKSAKDFIQLIASQPGKYSYAAHNASNLAAMGSFLRNMKLNMFHVPYKDGPQALTDITSGVITAMFNDVSGSAGLIQAGSLRPLAIMERERSRWLPEVPTVFEAGYDGPLIGLWTGVFAPAGTPPALISYLNSQIADVVAKPSLQARMEKAGLVLQKRNTPAAFAALIAEETQTLAPLLKPSR